MRITPRTLVCRPQPQHVNKDLGVERVVIPSLKMIAAEDTYQIRHRVLWPDKPISSIRIPEDNNAFHIGAFVDGKLVGVVSLFHDGENYQFRKLAVIAEYRGHGLGQSLVRECIVQSRKYGAKTLWCDARCTAVEFYSKLGFTIDSVIFNKNDKEYQKAYFDIERTRSKL